MPIQLKLLLVEQFVSHTKFGVHTALGLF